MTEVLYRANITPTPTTTTTTTTVTTTTTSSDGLGLMLAAVQHRILPHTWALPRRADAAYLASC